MKCLLVFLSLLSALWSSEVKHLDKAVTVGVAEKPQKSEKPEYMRSHYQITPRVNVITGEYEEEECDLVVAGCEPLSFRRFYGHFNPLHPEFSSWRMNPECSAIASFEERENDSFVAVGERGGNVSCYQKRIDNKTYTFGGDVQRSFMSLGLSGQNNPFNTRVNYRKTEPQEYRWEGDIIQGNGSIRHFCTEKNNFWPSQYELPVVEEKRPNGNVIFYSYEIDWDTTRDPNNDEIERTFPSHYRLVSITAYNSAKAKILTSLQLKYNTIQGTRAKEIEIIGSDGRRAILSKMKIKGARDGRYCLRGATIPDKPYVQYDYETFNGREQLKDVRGPEDRVFETEYDQNDKVKAQYAPVGSNGEMSPVFRYAYHDKKTEVFDAEGNKTIYLYDNNKRITTIESHEGGNNLAKVEHFSWLENGDLDTKKIEDGKCHLLLQQKYIYDKNHNVIEERVGDGQESYAIYRTYSSDGFNLKLSERDDYGKKIHYSYLPNTNLLASEFLLEGNIIRKRVFHFYDDCATCIKTIVDDGTTDNPNDLLAVTFRRITIIKPRSVQPCFGLPEVVEEKTIDAHGKEILLSKVVYFYKPSGKVSKEDHYDSTNTFRYSVSNEYDEKERLVATIDPLGQKKSFVYDANNNLLTLTGPRKDFWKEWTYDKMNRPLQERDNNNLITTKRYDKLGRVTASTDESGFETRFEYDVFGYIKTIYHPDGSIEKKETDALGRVIKERDGIGFETKKTYHFSGQPSAIFYPDGSKEFFTYRPDGKLLSSVDKNGAKRVLSYDTLGHLIKDELYSSSNALLKRSQATYSPFHKRTSIDPEGVLTTYSYDYAGNKISETIATKKTLFFYDSLQRLVRTQVGETVIVQELDLLNRVIEKRVEDLSHHILEKENYAYDALGNRTQVITSKGIKETLYNTRCEPVSEKDPSGNITKISYLYNKGLVKTITSPKNVQRIHIYDAFGREKESLIKNSEGKVIQRVSRQFDRGGNLTYSSEQLFEGIKPMTTNDRPSLVENLWTYGPSHHILSLLESGKKKTTYQYDTKGRLKSIVKPDGISLNHEYDEAGRLIRFYSSDFDYRYSYDKCDRPLQIEDRVTQTVTTRSYDAFGNVTQERLANDLTVKSAFDVEGRRGALFLPDNSHVAYTYRVNHLYSVSRNGFTHTYSERDSDGCIIKTQNALGETIIERDRLSRWKNMTAPHFTVHFPENGYDSTGNLISYSYTDPQGSANITYTYDDLDQLRSENEHTFLFDSMNNLLKKDDLSHTFNLLCQVTDAGYTYNANGDLLTQKTCTLEYDTQDRLISVTKGTHRLTYTYDPFHRRLSETLYNDGIKVKTRRFLWDGQDEIGSVDEKGNVTELRVLGEGLGAEIGAAILLELNGKAYVPIHDFRGSPVVLIDLATQLPAETIRYTAFGEELFDSKLSPWRFMSKRLDSDTGFVYFGRRHYSPELARWITPDPQGFADGPNLYAYVQNNPLTRIDLYGLRGVLNDLYDYCCRQESRTTHDSQSEMGSYRSCHHYRPDYEDGYSNKSRDYCIDGYKKPGLAFFSMNGMHNSYEEAYSNSKYASSELAGGMQISAVYNATHGFDDDVSRCIDELCHGVLTPGSIRQKNQWDDCFDKEGSQVIIVQFCHSEAAIMTRNSLEHYPPERRERIFVIAIAPAAYIPKELCLGVRHFVSERDMVPLFFDIPGRIRCSDTVVKLKPDKEADLLDHSFQSPTYKEPVSELVQRIIKRYGKEEGE